MAQKQCLALLLSEKLDFANDCVNPSMLGYRHPVPYGQ